jgi:predicted  nucleic acid-binding Zn-ribbon protein
MPGDMHDEVIAHIRERVATIRKIIAMAHDPRMIEMLEAMVDQAEADIRKLEAESGEAMQQQSVQPVDPGPKPRS